MERHSKAMRFVANLLDEVQHGRMVVKHHRLRLSPQHIEDFLLLGDGGKGLINDFECIERRRCGVKLADSTVHQDQVRERLLLLLEPSVAPRYHLAHAGEVVVLRYRLNDELAVVRLLHAVVFPDHHGRDNVRALDVRNVEALDTLGGLREVERLGQVLDHLAGARLHHAEAPLERVAGVARHQFRHGALGSGLRRQDVQRPAALLRQHLFQHGAIVEVGRHVDLARQIMLVEIELLEQGGKKLTRIEVLEVLPEKLAPVDDAAAAQVEEIHSQELPFLVEAEDVHVFAVARRHLLALAELLDGCEHVAVARRILILLAFGRLLHRLAQHLGQVAVAPGEQQSHQAHGFGVALGRGQALDARTQAALDVVLKARPRMIAREIHVARGYPEAAMDEVHDAIGEIRREVRAIVMRAVLLQAPRHVDARIPLGKRQLDVRVTLVVTQQDVVARLELLDEVVLERERLFLIVDNDGFEVLGGLKHQVALLVERPTLLKVGAHAALERLRLADVDGPALRVFEDVDARLAGQILGFLAAGFVQTSSPSDYPPGPKLVKDAQLTARSRQSTMPIMRLFLRLLVASALALSLTAASPRAQDQSTRPPATNQNDNDEPVYTPPGAPKSVEIGNYYFRKKRYRAALSRYEEATQTDPYYAEGYLGLGKSYDKIGLKQKALDAYHKYLDLLPSEKQADEAKKVHEAIARLERSLKRSTSPQSALRKPVGVKP